MNFKKHILILSLMLFSVFSIASAQQGSGKKILFIGDSITDGGWGNSGGEALPSDQRNLEDWNHLFGHGFMYICAAHYMGHFPEKGLAFYNRGISGNTLQDLTNRWDKDCISIKPDVVSILIGTNDIHYWIDTNNPSSFDFENWKNNLQKLISDTRLKLEGAQIILCTPFVVNAGWVGRSASFTKRETAVKKLAQIVKQIAQSNHLECVCFDEILEQTIQKYPDIPLTHWSWDGIHPTPAFHQLMADLWIKTINL